MATSASSVDPAHRNRLLAALPAGERGRVIRRLTPTFLQRGDILFENGTPPDRIYFPTSAIVSLNHLAPTGSVGQIVVIGKEGVVGLALRLGEGSITPSRAVVQSAGWVHGLAGPILRKELARGGALRPLLLRHTQALLAQVVQTAWCARQHSIDQQRCRWELLRLDSLSADDHSGPPDVADRVGLEARVCECYGAIKAESERVFRRSASSASGARPRSRR